MSGPIRALIVDDEPAAREAIRTLLRDHRDVAVVGDCPDGPAALAALETENADLLFLDIQMPEMDGFAVLRQLDPERLPVVVFVTAHDQYALRAFDAQALDYLLKPFSDERFHDSVRRAKQQVRQGRLGALSREMLALLANCDADPAARPGNRYLSRLVLKADGRITFLAVEDVDWIEAKGDYVRIHAGKSCHLMRETMQHIEQLFDPARFVRVHRSAIVNVERIREMQPYFRGEYVLILQDGSKLKLSRGRKTQLETALRAAPLIR